jgi:hypothetical protein
MPYAVLVLDGQSRPHGVPQRGAAQQYHGHGSEDLQLVLQHERPERLAHRDRGVEGVSRARRFVAGARSVPHAAGRHGLERAYTGI